MMEGECILYFSSDSSSSEPYPLDPLALDPLALDGEVLTEGHPSALKTVTSDEKARSTNQKRKRVPFVIPDYITVGLSRCGKFTLYECNLCSKKFKTKAHIKYHEYCKTGKKPLQCNTCGQGFIAASHLAYHIKTHTGDRPYRCTVCGIKLIRQSNVTRHMKTHSRIRTGKRLGRLGTPHACYICNAEFANRQDFTSHMLIHPGVSSSPFRCLICSMTFTRKDNLQRHLQKIHDHRKEVSLVLCNEAIPIATAQIQEEQEKQSSQNLANNPQILKLTYMLADTQKMCHWD